MRRPSAWVALPVVAATVAGGVLGYLITRASCAPRSCVVWSVTIGTATAIAMLVGVGVVMVLAVRSIAEWRALDPDEEPRREAGGPPVC